MKHSFKSNYNNRDDLTALKSALKRELRKPNETIKRNNEMS